MQARSELGKLVHLSRSFKTLFSVSVQLCFTLIFHFSVKPSSHWQRKYHGKNRAYWRPHLAANGVIFQPQSHCLIRLYNIITKLRQKKLSSFTLNICKVWKYRINILCQFVPVLHWRYTMFTRRKTCQTKTAHTHTHFSKFLQISAGYILHLWKLPDPQQSCISSNSRICTAWDCHNKNLKKNIRYQQNKDMSNIYISN